MPFPWALRRSRSRARTEPTDTPPKKLSLIGPEEASPLPEGIRACAYLFVLVGWLVGSGFVKRGAHTFDDKRPASYLFSPRARASSLAIESHHAVQFKPESTQIRRF